VDQQQTRSIIKATVNNRNPTKTSRVVRGLADITVAILAGGLGTRLRIVVPDRPKVLAEVSGRPFIVYLLDQLAREGAQTVVLCTGYMGEQVENQLGTTYEKMALRYSHEASPLGTGGALRLALPMLASKSVLVMNGDSYCDARLGPFAGWHDAQQAMASILLTKTSDTRRYGRIDLDKRGSIIQFREKSSEMGSGWINAGIYLLSRELIETIPADRSVSIERETFPAWIGRGLFGYRSKGKLLDIGVPEAYARAGLELETACRGES
jgi:D-glycero-alpha-D-manno-heptose 1-phosphate guanylyltransferase